MNPEENTVREFLEQKIRALRVRMEMDEQELAKLEAALAIYEGRKSNFTITRSLTRVTFASQIHGLLKEVNRPVMSSELRKMYNMISGKPEMPSNRFASRMSTSKSKGKFHPITVELNSGERNFWLLDKWFADEDGSVKPEYKKYIDEIVAKDEEANIF